MRTLIAIPAMDMMHTIFVKSLIGLDRVGQTQIAFTSSSLVYDARNGLAKKAASEGFDRMLWLDSDMEFGADFMKKLSADIDDGCEMVCGLYFKRKAPVEPVIYKEVGYYHSEETREVTPVALAYDDYPKDELFEVGGCGFGGVMMTVDLIKRVVAEFGQPFSPVMGFGEDLSFCKRVSHIGAKMWCDSRAKMGHVGQGTITEETYLQTRCN